jgi:hypothetical protein
MRLQEPVLGPNQTATARAAVAAVVVVVMVAEGKAFWTNNSKMT